MDQDELVGLKLALLSPERRALLEMLRKKKKSGERLNTLEAARRTYPLSFEQEQMWINHLLNPQDPSYNNPAAVRLRGYVDLKVLERILSEIVRRHQLLRCSIVARDGVPVQILRDACSIQILFHDLSELPERVREEECRRIAKQEVNKPFMLAEDIMMRAQCIMLSKQEHILIVNFHHIASDGWSLGVFFHEFSILYEAFVNGRPSPLPNLTYQYFDYAEDQRKRLQGEYFEKQLGYWTAKLGTHSGELHLPTDRPRPQQLSNAGNWYPVRVPAPLSSELKDFYTRQGTTLFIVLMAVYATLLHIYTAQLDISIGTPFVGRGSLQTEQLIGCFVNTLVFRIDLSGNPTFLEILQRVQEVAVEAYDHQDVPFAKIVESMSSKRKSNINPYFQAMLVINNAPLEGLKLPDISIERYNIYPSTARFDWLLSVSEVSTGIVGYLNYKTELFDEKRINIAVSDFLKVLAQVVNNSQISLWEIRKRVKDDGAQDAKPKRFQRKGL